MSNHSKKEYLEGSLMTEAEFLPLNINFALARYKLAGDYLKKMGRGKIVLDAGSGSGFGTHQLAQAGAKKIFGIDINPRAIRYSKARYRQFREKNLIFQEGDLTALKFSAGFFDLVIAFEVIEHIQNSEQAISEFFRVLKPGGILIISTPNKVIYSPDTQKPFYPFHFHEFYAEEFKDMLKKFQILSIKGQYLKGQKIMLYPRLHPKRIIRACYANLPAWLKLLIIRLYLKFRFWLYQRNPHRPGKIKLADVYFSDDFTKSRILVAVCRKICTRAKEKR